VRDMSFTFLSLLLALNSGSPMPRDGGNKVDARPTPESKNSRPKFYAIRNFDRCMRTVRAQNRLTLAHLIA